MNQKLAAIKTKIKAHAPVIIATASVATTIAVIVYHQTKTTLGVSKEDLEMVKTEDINLRYSIDGSDYALRYIGNTPKN